MATEFGQTDFQNEVLYRTDFQAYRAALVQFKQEQAEAGDNNGTIEEAMSPLIRDTM